MDPNQTVTSTGLVTTSSDSLKETMNHMDWLNLPLNLFDLLEYVSSSAFDELHRSIFDDRFIARLQDGKTITTSSMLIDTTKAIVDVDDIIESAGDASEINPLPQFRLKTPSGELQTPQDIYEGVRESKYARLSEETVNRLTQIRTAWKTMMSAGWTRLEESDLCVLAEEKTTKDAEDIATFLARILKKQTCMTDRVATE